MQMGTQSLHQVSTLPEMYRFAADTFGDRPAFATRDKNKVFQPVSFKKLYEQGLALAAALVDLGVEAREHVAILADNRYEWILADYAVQLTGAADVPRGSDVTAGDINYILPHSGAKVVFVENSKVLNLVRQNRASIPDLKHIIVMDRNTSADDELHLYDLLKKGEDLRAKGDQRVEERIAGVTPQDLFTLIYTSGTTGAPKGVMLSHANVISQVKNLPFELAAEERLLSILPIWHIFERVFEMVAIGRGACTYYTSVRNFKVDLKLVRPTFMASAPRLWESIYQGLLKNVKSSSPVKQALFKAAYFCAERFQGSIRFLKGNHIDLNGRSLPVSLFWLVWHFSMQLLFALPYLILDAIVLKKIRAATGGCLKCSASGGGALPIQIDRMFNNIGIPVLEGYGMTETCPVISVRTFKKLVIGTVGPIFPQTEVRLVDPENGKDIYPPDSGRGQKGEIHVRGPQVMKGYYKNAEATANVLKDGWMNTGDLGVMTYNGCLKIVGRSKDTIVLMGGENVEPEPIECKLLESPKITQCTITGQDRKALTALLVPDEEEMKDFGATLEQIAANEEARKIIRAEVKRLICNENGFKPFEQIFECDLLSKPFEVGDELTNLGKIKRHVVAEKYKDRIERMYSPKYDAAKNGRI